MMLIHLYSMRSAHVRAWLCRTRTREWMEKRKAVSPLTLPLPLPPSRVARCHLSTAQCNDSPPSIHPSSFALFPPLHFDSLRAVAVHSGRDHCPSTPSATPPHSLRLRSSASATPLHSNRHRNTALHSSGRDRPWRTHLQRCSWRRLRRSRSDRPTPANGVVRSIRASAGDCTP